MKITGIEIGEYHQFKNIKFDFTYPEGHAKAGQPLEKVCFIGQSGTGKTTLLDLVWRFLLFIDDTKSIIEDDQFIEQGVFNEYVRKNIVSTDNNVEIYFHLKNENNSINCISPYIKRDRKLLNINNIVSELEAWLEIIGLGNSLDTDGLLCLSIDDSSINKADYLTDFRESDEQLKKAIIATVDKIETEREKHELHINEFSKHKVVDVSKADAKAMWIYLLKDAIEYSINFKKLITEIANKKSISPKIIADSITKWQAENPNPNIVFIDQCLKPFLDKFHLEVDLENNDSLIVIKSKYYKDHSYTSTDLSTGTRQLLATAIPIYKFNTNNTVILFDEPERSLFPDIQRGLVKYYASLAPEAQFFFATHSPIIASAFEPCERFILHFDEKGNVKVRNGTAPIGDDPNDLLSSDFDMSELMLDEGLEQYKRYTNLFLEIKKESDQNKKNKLIAEQAHLGNKYNF